MIEMDREADGCLRELRADGARVKLERMADDVVALILETDEKRVVVDLVGTKRAPIRFELFSLAAIFDEAQGRGAK